MVNAEIDNPSHELANEINAKQKIWDYLIRNMGGWNRITLIQTQASAELGISKVHICRCLKDLEERRFIVKIGKSQTNNIYMINPRKVWNGEADAHAAGISKFEQLIMGNKASWLEDI
jgi:hypothetical protein